jgi:rhodanese-related sulfurtransferase
MYVLMAFVAFIAYKKYTQYQVLKLVPNLLAQGGQIVDVRTVEEFASANKNGSINIPLDALNKRINELDKTKPIIVCCASGSRSAIAKRTFLSNGFDNVHNVGTWKSLKKF